MLTGSNAHTQRQAMPMGGFEAPSQPLQSQRECEHIFHFLPLRVENIWAQCSSGARDNKGVVKVMILEHAHALDLSVKGHKNFIEQTEGVLARAIQLRLYHTKHDDHVSQFLF